LVVAPGRRPPLPANAYSAAAQLLSDPAWAQAHRIMRSGANTTLNCNVIRGPGTDTGIALQASTDHLNRGSDLEA